ncbi:sigma-70 family RNA polymerase sigma factor [Novispirillum sp. DQ9]|uniref:sigma-70 family RNA polymerase sigma factor n=1 Tax=Novispirillum sp. DQ9 TaxID=3398612 RepID=UPI003C7B42AA
MIAGMVEDDERAALAGHIGAVAQHRDKQAFAALFRFYAPRVKGYLIRQGCAAAQAEDLAQEVLAAVWRKAGLYDPAKAEPSTWVFTIARNLRIDALRRERHPQVDLEDVPEQSDDRPAADDLVASGQRAVLVRRAIASLPADQADVVHRAFFEDKVHTEIAEELGVPLGTVKSRMRLAMNKIRAALGEQEV